MPVSVAANGTKLWRRRTTRADWLHFAGWLGLVMLFVFTWRVMTDRGSPATSAVISTPRFIGPGCITSACAGSRAARAASRP